MGKNHKDSAELHHEIGEAKKKVEVGGIYSHYKNPKKTYKVIQLGFFESTDEICVVYQAMYDSELIFIRPLHSWLEEIEIGDRKKLRFIKIS